MAKSKTAGKGWADTGFDGIEEGQKYAAKPGENRFYLKKGTEKRVVFLNDAPFKFHEHQLNMNGNWRNWFTCIKNVDERGCPLCKLAEKTETGYAYQVGAFTIIDRTGFKKRDGTAVKNNKTLLMAKRESLQKFKVQNTRREGLEGTEYLVARSTADTSASVGDDWEFNKKHEDLKETFEGVDITEFDYSEEFEPKTYEELETIVAKITGDTSAEVDESDGDDDEKIDY